MRQVIKKLFSTDAKIDQSLTDLNESHNQAKKFLNYFLSSKVNEKTYMNQPQKGLFSIDSTVASQKDIIFIFNFFYKYAQDQKMSEENIKNTKQSHNLPGYLVNFLLEEVEDNNHPK